MKRAGEKNCSLHRIAFIEYDSIRNDINDVNGKVKRRLNFHSIVFRFIVAILRGVHYYSLFYKCETNLARRANERTTDTEKSDLKTVLRRARTPIDNNGRQSWNRTMQCEFGVKTPESCATQTEYERSESDRLFTCTCVVSRSRLGLSSLSLAFQLNCHASGCVLNAYCYCYDVFRLKWFRIT